jgi:uncharacterized LabA/DUF88 family protein
MNQQKELRPKKAVTTNKASNVYAFIDSTNLHLSISNQGWKLDYRRFRRYLEDKFSVSKAFMFIGYVPTNQDLYSALQSNGYILVFKPTLKLPSGKPKGNVDAELVLHTMLEYRNYDAAVIVAGDGDYYCLVNYLDRQGKLCRLIIPDKNDYSSLYRKFASKNIITFMNDLQSKLDYKSAKNRGGITSGQNPLDSLPS